MAAPAAYSNLHLVRPVRPSAASRKAEANTQRQAETRVKRKVEQAHAILSALEARSAGLAAQIKELQKRKAAADARTTNLEDKILVVMQTGGLDEVAGLRVTFHARPATAAVIVDDVKLIPGEYIRETLVSAPDKVAIKSALQRNIDVPGVHLSQKVSLIRK